ncbi:MAG: GLUG motif-containing protein [Planctomycetota bacterium]|jgi:hypothetical protein
MIADRWREMKRQVILVLAMVVLLAEGASVAGTYSGGDGSAEYPYRIATPNDLNEIGANPNDWDNHFVLTNDINMADYTYSTALIAPDLDAATLGFEGTAFTGVFDGNEHIIINFTIDAMDGNNSTRNNYLGLFGKTDSTAEIKNLGIEDVNLITASPSVFCGGLVGFNWASVNNCFTNGTVLGGTYAGAVGGLIGLNAGTIENCSATGEINGEREIAQLVGINLGEISYCHSTANVYGIYTSGGLVGSNSQYGKITNCYCSGLVFCDDEPSLFLGGFIGINDGSIINCYSTASVSSGSPLDSESFGGLAGANRGIIKNCYSIGSVSMVTNSGGFVGENKGFVHLSYWDKQASGRSDGDGGIGKTTAEMFDMDTFIGWGDDKWKINDGHDYPRLVWQNTPGTIIVDPPRSYGGGSGTENEPYIIYTAEQLNTIGTFHQDSNCCFVLAADVNLSNLAETFNRIVDFSGVFDGSGFKIKNLIINDGQGATGLFASVRSGGIVKNLGVENAQIEFTGGNLLGVIAAASFGTIGNCYSTGAIWGGHDSTYVGGLVGYNGGEISNCYSEASVWGYDDTGGLIGWNRGTISNCHAAGDILTTGWSTIGGFVGFNQGGTISNCFAIGDVSGQQRIGGFGGRNSGGTIKSCYATGDVSGTSYVGGLFGRSGSLVSIISNCYAAGNVSGESDVGGLVGRNYSTPISNCYAVGEVNGITNIGGLVGNQYTSMYPTQYTSCFWDSNVNPDVNGIGNANDPNAIGKTTAEMQTRSTFTDSGWDFVGETANGTNDIWDICEGMNYPKLSWWQPVLGDFVCPDGVDMRDFAVLAEQWQLEKLSEDVAPNGGDGTVNFLDWVAFANGWKSTKEFEDLSIFVEQWLQLGAYCADIAPAPDSDGIVDKHDLNILCNNWLAGL